MEAKVKFSILINNFNYARFLPDALQSVASQSIPPYEIIVVDDGSTDESLEMLETCKATIPNLVVLQQANAGQFAAIHHAVSIAKGEWCVFLDADDTWESNHLEFLNNVISEHREISAIYSGHKESHGNPVYRIPWPEGIIGPSMALIHVTRLRIGTLTSAIALRTDIAKQAVDLAPEMWSDWRIRADDCLVYGAALHGAIAYHQPTPSVRYRIHGDNAYAGRDRAYAEYRDKFRLARLCQYYANKTGILDNDIASHIKRELTFPGNSHPYIRRRYRRAIRNLDISLYSKISLYLKAIF